jgi:hypothetical protein
MFENINWLAVAASVAAMMFLGYAWYSMKLFGRPWMMLIGKQEADLKAGAGKAIGGMLVMAAIQVITFAYLFDALGYAYESINGLTLAAWISFGLLLPVMMSGVLFEQRPPKLFWITWGYQFVGMAIVGLIISAWPA